MTLDTLTLDVYPNIFSSLSEAELTDLQTASKSFYYLTSINSIWKKCLDNMCVKNELNEAKRKVAELYRHYIKYLKDALKLEQTAPNIFQLKDIIDIHLRSQAAGGEIYYRLHFIFNKIIEKGEYFLIPLICPHVQPEWKNYALTTATEKAFLFVPRLISLGAIPNSHCLNQAIKNCSEHVPLLLQKGAKPDIETFKIAEKYCPQYINSIFSCGSFL